MFLNWLKRLVKAALHEATEEWALEVGLPKEVVQEMRTQRLTLAAQAEARADAAAAMALGVEEQEPAPEEPKVILTRPALPMASAAQVTTQELKETCPAPGDDEATFLGWVHVQREQNVSWAEVARQANESGHQVGEDALKMRYYRWRQKTGQIDGDNPPNT